MVRWKRLAREGRCKCQGCRGTQEGRASPWGFPPCKGGARPVLPPTCSHWLQGAAETFILCLPPHTPPLPDTQIAEAGPEPALDAEAWLPRPAGGVP